MNYTNLSDAQVIALLHNPKVAIAISIISIWSLIWKGFALWKAGQNGSKPWFIVLLVANTVGILEIVYIFFFSKKKGGASNN